MRRSMFLLFGLVLALSACQTMSGFGRDLQSGGRALEGSAERNR